MEELATRYFGARSWLVFTNLTISADLGNNLKSRILVLYSKFQISILEHEFFVSKRFLVLDLMV